MKFFFFDQGESGESVMNLAILLEKRNVTIMLRKSVKTKGS